MAGTLDFLSGNNEFFYPWGGPMNGQTARLEIARHIIHTCKIAQIVETGTFRGTTADWFASFDLPMVTIEADHRFAEFARRRLSPRKKARVMTGDSIEVMTKLGLNSISAQGPALFYLDAHWAEYLPLADEMKLIVANVAQYVVMIDDFAVPWDSGYKFDDYGPGKRLDIDYLFSASAIKDQSIFFPSVAAREETGSRSGCVVITGAQNLAAELKKTSLLREWHKDTSNMQRNEKL